MDNKKLLLELDKYRREVNKQTLNPEIDEVNLDLLKPIVQVVATSRADYILYLIKITNENKGSLPSSVQMAELVKKRKVFEELVKATNAFETIIERDYLDMAERVS